MTSRSVGPCDIQPARGDTPGDLVITIEQPHDVAEEEFKKRYDSLMGDIRFYVEGWCCSTNH